MSGPKKVLGGLGLVHHLCDGVLENTDFNVCRDLDFYFVVFFDLGNFADDTALRYNLVAFAQRFDHIAVILHLFLLRTDHQKIHDGENQDDWNKTAKAGR